jgi:hypothetical protein
MNDQGFSPRESFRLKKTTTGAESPYRFPNPNAALEGPLFHG